MPKADHLISTKLRQPFTRSELVPRARLQELLAAGLRGPLTLVIAPAGFGKTTLVASCVADCGMSVAWLSLDREDNQVWRFISYLVAAVRSAGNAIGRDAARVLADAHPAPTVTILTSLINDLDTAGSDIVLVLDDYQFITSQAVHDAMAFLLEHRPRALHVVIASRSDPPLHLARLRARGQAVELRAADLRFTETEAAQFLNDVMGLRLDARSVAALGERTEGWIAGLQMASIALQSHLSMRDRQDVHRFIEAFSGTNRYILDYLLEEVLAGQPPEIQHFLLVTSILERLTAPLCESLLKGEERGTEAGIDERSLVLQPPAHVLDYLDRANLFLAPLDDDRRWYRYHHLFADLLRTQLQKSLGDAGVARLHLRAATWHEQNGSVLEAIHHASEAADDGMVERLIQQNYLDMMNRGEMSWVRSWMGSLSREVVCRRPWLCLYEAMNRCWYGQLEEAVSLLDEAEKRIRAGGPAADTRSMLGYHAYVKSRVTAMQGDTRRAIELCRTARETVPADRLDLQIDFSITLGYEHFLYGDFDNASRILNETIQAGHAARAINNPVAAYCLLSRIQRFQGRLHEAEHLLQRATELTHEVGGRYLGAVGLVDVEMAALLCEWNDLDASLAHVKRGLDYLNFWGKADDFCLAYVTLARVQLARGDRAGAADAIGKAGELVRTCGVFSEARGAVEAAQVRSWLAEADRLSVDRWLAAPDRRSSSQHPARYEHESVHIAQARALIALHRRDEAIQLLSRLEESARSSGREGRLVEILLLQAQAQQAAGRYARASSTLASGLVLAEPSGYVRIFLDEGRPMHFLLAQWLAHADAGPLRNYADRLLSQFDTGPYAVSAAQNDVSSGDIPSTAPGQSSGEAGTPVGRGAPPDSLSQRELEVLHFLALGRTNQEIARQLVVAPGTIKAHTASIYRKLDVANRTEAVACARRLGILP